MICYGIMVKNKRGDNMNNNIGYGSMNLLVVLDAFKKYCVRQSPNKIFSRNVVIKNGKLNKLRYVSLTFKPILDSR